MKLYGCDLFGRTVLTLLAASASLSNAVEVLSLTPSSYAAATANKIVFIKFFAPWVSE